MSQHLLAPTSNWLSTDCVNLNAVTTTSGGCGVGNTTTYYGDWYQSTWYPYYQPIVHYSYFPDSRPIKLTLSEVERLRKVAKTDGKLKAILAKFTHQIEIAVDFD